MALPPGLTAINQENTLPEGLTALPQGLTPIAPQAQSPFANTGEPEEERGWLADIGIQIPTGLVKGAINTVRTANDLLAGLDSFLPQEFLDFRKDVNDKLGFWSTREDMEKSLRGAVQELPEAQTIPGAIAGVGSQVLAPMGVVSTGLKIAGIANTFVRGSLAGAVTDFAVFDQAEGNLSNILQEYDSPLLNNAVTQGLSIDADDSKLEAGIKQAAEGLVVGPALEVLLQTARIAKAGVQAKLGARAIKKNKPIFEEAVSRFEEAGYNRQVATDKALKVTGLDKADFVKMAKADPELLSKADQKIDLNLSTTAELSKMADELEIDTSKLIDVKATKAVQKEQIKQQAAAKLGLNTEEAKELFTNFDAIIKPAKKIAKGSKTETVGGVAARLAKESWAEKSRIQSAKQIETLLPSDIALKAGAPEQKPLFLTAKEQRTQEEAIEKIKALNKEGKEVPKSLLKLADPISYKLAEGGTKLPSQANLALGEQGFVPPKTEQLKQAEFIFPGAKTPEQARPFTPMEEVPLYLQGGVAKEEPLKTVVSRGRMIKAVEKALEDKKFKDATRTDKVAKMVEKELTRNTKSNTWRDLPKDVILGVRERINEISPTVAHALNRFEQAVHQRKFLATEESRNFVQQYGKLSKAEQLALDDALLNENTAKLGEVFSRRPILEASFNKVKSVLETFKKDGEDVGAIVAGREGLYFPRVVKDYPGLLKALGSKHRTALEDAIRDAGGDGLSVADKTDIINKYLRTHIPSTMKAGKTSHGKGRAIDAVPEELQKFYSNSVDSLNHYIGTMSDNIEKRRFLGYTKDSGISNVDMAKDKVLRGSIGARLLDDKMKGNITDADMEDISTLLQARLGSGEKASSVHVQNAKNFMYMGVLANPVSAVTQLGDIALAAHVNGIGNTIVGLVKVLAPGVKALSKEDLGISSALADIQGGLRSHKWLGHTMKVSLFSGSDSLGKSTIINGSFRKYKNMAKTMAGEKKIREQYTSAFSPEQMDNVIVSLRKGEITPDVKYLMWNDLTKMQPISMSEMPVTYLNNPNGRLFYAMKTFTVKGLNRLYYDGIKQIRDGNVKAGAGNLVKYAGLLTAGGMSTDAIKDAMQNRDQQDFDDRFVSNLWKVVGSSDYITDKVRQGDLKGATLNTIIPPVGPMGFSLGADIAKSPIFDPEAEWKPLSEWKSFKYVPLVGKIGYNWFGGGAEAYNERLAKEEQ